MLWKIYRVFYLEGVWIDELLPPKVWAIKKGLAKIMIIAKNLQFSPNPADILPKWWLDNFGRISAWLDKNYRFFNNRTFLS